MSNPTGDAQNSKQVSPPYTPVDGCQAEMDECQAAYMRWFTEKEGRRHTSTWLTWKAAWQARATTKGRVGITLVHIHRKGFPSHCPSHTIDQ